jgi:chemosensory pili system protein ChpA (sensor histidine kinase/response regulator)
MSTYRKVDPSTLGWVKSEIDETLKQARLALENFVENPADRSRLRFCITHLHQVVGTLLMVELDGAAFMAREVEALAEALMEDKAPASQAALESLTRGILVLPDYLARLQYGHPDVPFKHLALLNELRTARKAQPIAELDLFNPDLSVRPPPVEGRERAADAEFAALARQQRAAYQGALLNWLRDTANVEPLSTIASVLDELQAKASTGVLEQLFWVAGGLLEGMIAGELEPTPERKKHLARLDQQIKKIADGVEKSVLRSTSEAVVRSILHDLAHVQSAAPKIVQLKQAFRLDELLGESVDDVDLDAPDKPSPEVLKSVAVALGKEVEQAQDMLATAFEARKTDAKSLAPLMESLHKIAGTVEMAGAPALKQLVDELVTTCTELGEGRIANSDAAAMPIAQALLAVESGARELHRSDAQWQQQVDQALVGLRALLGEPNVPGAHGIEVSDAALTEVEYQQLLGVVAGEVGVNLGRIEEALEGFATHTTQLERLDDVPKQLEQIQGALQILGAERAVELALVTRRHIDQVRERSLAVDSDVLDALAICVGTLGAYVDGLKAGRKNIDSLVESALREVEIAVKEKLGRTGRSQDPVGALRERLDAWFGEPADVLARTQVQEQLARVVALPSIDSAKSDMIARECGRLIDLVADDPNSLSEEVEQTLRASCDALGSQLLPEANIADAPAPLEDTTAGSVAIEPPPPSPVRQAPAPVAVAKPAAVPDEEFDQEILEIFIEDARDVYGNVVREYANWSADPSNASALAELRRGYHTLKGSGRMVGATQIADLAWAVENMLNYVRDGKIAASPEVIAVVAESQTLLPDMIGELEGGPGPAGDAAALATRAQDLVERRGDSSPAARADATLPKLDGVLLEIFTNEAQGHIAAIRAQIAECRDAGTGCLVTPALTRAIHTLQGNARSLGIRVMAESCAESERLLHALQVQHLPLLPEHLDLLENFATTVENLVERVGNESAESEEIAQAFEKIAGRLREEHEKFALPEHGHAAAEPAHVRPPVSKPAPVAAPRPIVDEEPTIAWDSVDADDVAPAPMPVAREPTIDSGVDPELLEIFQEEATDILDHVEQALRAWRARPDDMGTVLELKRALHTLKGGARMAGLMTMGDISHHTESLLMQVESRVLMPSSVLFDLLEETHDALVSMLNRIARGQPPASVDVLMARLTATLDESEMPVPVRPTVEAEQPSPAAAPKEPPHLVRAPVPPVDTAARTEPVLPAAPANKPTVVPLARMPEMPTPAATRSSSPHDNEAASSKEGSPATETEPWVDRRERPGQIRVNTGLLNSLVNYAGEVSIARSRMEQQIYGFRDNLAELRRNAVRFRDQLRELEIQSESQILYRLDQSDPTSSEFDPLEFDRFSRLQQLTRSLTESLHDLTTIQLNMGNFVGEAEAVLQQQARLNTELQEGLMRTRMVEFGTQAARLRHIARQTARELGKRAELDIVGGDVQIDRTVLDRMISPFEHMIRNSIDHGIETEAERARRGKPPMARISVTAKQEGNEIVIRFADDGAGMNIEKIRAKAIERGLISADANLTEDDVLQFVLLSGFSTAARVTQLSGRGVGMDVVHSEVKQLGGSMSVNTEAGKGTTFVIRLPLTLSITQALMVYVGDQQFAMPLAAVSNIIECTPEQLNRLGVGKNPLLNHNDKLYSFMNLGARLGIASAGRDGRKVPVLLARAGAREVAIQVDGLGGTREIVIKALGPQLAEIKGLAGATIMGDGRVVLILDVAGLWYVEETLHIEHTERPAVVEEVRTRPVIMVVDDSLTVRKVTGKHLQKRGYDVMVAKDGIDAVEQLRTRIPDLMLVDIEMPRMDGYELTGRVRGDPTLKHIPIIMITSRAGEKHRNRALDLGVNIYMSKPYQEDDLFNNVETLLARGRPH